MLNPWLVIGVSGAYLGLLFAVAFVGDRRADRGRSIISNGYIYGLSLCVFATSWTFYGSVGRAATTGVGFLSLYLGPTVMAAAWWLVLRKIIRICKRYRITSLSDFMSSRYGKHRVLGELVTVIAVFGIVPYIALQLKAISNTFTILRGQPELAATAAANPPILADTALYVALLLAAFTIVFGTRHLDATERHEGMVAAIAFESLVKLVAFLAVGVYVTYGLFDGFGDLFRRAEASPQVAQLLTFKQIEGSSTYASWMWLVVLSMLAILLLPRQWQVAVVENVDEQHIKTASWLFPLYLLLINVFVLPIGIAGRLTFGDGGANRDAYVLALPMANQQAALALLVFIGGLSAATGMVIVETIALSTMVSNSLVLPVLLRRGGTWVDRRDLGRLTLRIRRVTIVVILLLGFAYFRLAGEALDLVSIGLISFAAVAQFAPAIFGGLYWRGATGRGAIWGLAAGFAVWAYTLPLPSLVDAGYLPASFVKDGPFGISALAPHALFGLDGLDTVSHSMLWSMMINVGLFVGLSLTGRQEAAERVQALKFVDVFTNLGEGTDSRLWRGTVTVGQLQTLLGRFLGPEGARVALDAYATKAKGSSYAGPDGSAGPVGPDGSARSAGRSAEPERSDLSPETGADADLVHHVETLLTGVVGSASARFMVASVVDEEPLAVSEVVRILDETSHVLASSRALERKSEQLEVATSQLQEANARLKELDRLKDDFVSTITHELRTPLTSIRAFSEILVENPELDLAEREGYLRIVVEESERLTRLINQVLDLAKLESGDPQWLVEPVDLGQVLRTSAEATAQVFRDREVVLEVEIPDPSPVVRGDPDRLIQVTLNLLSNAVKFCPPGSGLVRVVTTTHDGVVQVDVKDNGPGIAEQDQEVIFEKFRQGGDTRTNRPSGTGLGLPISRLIIDHLGGRLWVESTPGQGARFSFELPVMITGTALVTIKS